MKFISRKTLLASAMALMFSFSAVSADAAMSRKPQDNIFFATGNEPAGLDPALVDDNDSGNILCNIYESLLRFKPASTEVEPSLAESWTISEDGLTYTFKLRQGVKFHDGTPFNAEAVKFNFDRQRPENLVPKMSYAPFVFGDVESTTVVDEYTVAVKLKNPSTPFLRNMAMVFAAPIVSPTALKAGNNSVMDKPVGTGPYKLFAWDRGQQIILTTNEDYWDEKPSIQNVIYRVMKDTSARVVALNNGEVDIITAIDPNVIPEIEKNGGKIYAEEGPSTNYMLFNTRDGFMCKDREVRKAIAQAIDVPSLVESLYQGYSLYATTWFPSFMDGYDPNTKPVQYDPEAAKKFFEQKGIKSLKIMTYSNARPSNTAGGQVLAEAIQSYLAKVGVKADIIVYDYNTYRGKLLTDSWDLSFLGWAGDNGDPDNFINIFANDDPVANNGLWKNEEFRKLVIEAARTPEGPKRVEMYKQADRIIAEDVGVLPLSHPKDLLAYRPNISGPLNTLSVIYFRYVKKE